MNELAEILPNAFDIQSLQPKMSAFARHCLRISRRYLMLMKEDRSFEFFALACGTVANLMEEEGLSRPDALKFLYAMLLEPHIPRVVRDAITRLEATKDERELWKVLGQESRITPPLKKRKALSPPLPKSLFD